MKLTEQNITDLRNYINQIPTQYGLPLLQWIQGIQEQEKKAEKKK